MMHSIQNSNYMQNFPSKVPTKMAQSFLLTSTIELIIGSGTKLAFLGGGIAVLATGIEAATRPLFRDVFRDTPNIALATQIAISLTMAFSLASLLTPWIGLSYKVTTFMIPLIATFCLNHEFYVKNEGFAVIL